jgi:hypothetical protein
MTSAAREHHPRPAHRGDLRICSAVAPARSFVRRTTRGLETICDLRFRGVYSLLYTTRVVRYT